MHLSTVTVAGLLITQASEQNVPSLSLISHKKKTDKQRWLTIRLRIIRSSVTSRGSCTSHYQIQENVKKNQDWLVIDRFNVHSTLRVQSSDAFLYNNCFRNIFRSCWTRNKSRAFCYWKNSLSIFSKSYRHNTNSKPIVRVTSEHKYYYLPGCMDPILFLVKYKPFIQYT